MLVLNAAVKGLRNGACLYQIAQSTESELHLCQELRNSSADSRGTGPEEVVVVVLVPLLLPTKEMAYIIAAVIALAKASKPGTKMKNLR